MAKIYSHPSSLNANYSTQKGHTSKLLAHSESWKSVDEFEKKSTIFCWDLPKLWASKVEVWLIPRSFLRERSVENAAQKHRFPIKTRLMRKILLNLYESLVQKHLSLAFWGWSLKLESIGMHFQWKFWPPSLIEFGHKLAFWPAGLGCKQLISNLSKQMLRLASGFSQMCLLATA